MLRNLTRDLTGQHRANPPVLGLELFIAASLTGTCAASTSFSAVTLRTCRAPSGAVRRAAKWIAFKSMMPTYNQI